MPYRSFKLITMGGKPVMSKHIAVNRSKHIGSTRHLGPMRAAQKLFDAQCRKLEVGGKAAFVFQIQETTRGKAARVFTYAGERSELASPREVKRQREVSVYTITYRYKTTIKSVKK